MITWERLTIAEGATEPVTAEQLAAYGRITDAAELPQLSALITAAREETERLTGRILVLGSFRLEADTAEGLSRAQFPIAPVVSVDSVSWVGGTVPPEIPATAAQGARNLFSNVQWADPTIVPLIAWQTVFWAPAIMGGAVPAQAAASSPATLLRIDLTAGYATAAAVPEGMRHFVQTLALLRYAHRDDPDALQRAQAFAASGVSAFGVVQA